MTAKVGVYAEEVECVTYSIAKSISLGDYRVFVITNKDTESEQRRIYLKKIGNIKGLEIIDFRENPSELDVLCVELLPNFSKRYLDNWCSKAKELSAISYTTKNKLNFQQNLLNQAKEVVKYFPHSTKFKNIGFLNGFLDLDIYSFLARDKYPAGFDVHSKFVEDEALYTLMFSFNWIPQDSRKYKLNFLGNVLPQARTQILREIKEYLQINDLVQGNDISFCFSDTQLIWLEYDHSLPMNKRGLSSQEYIDCLTSSDFTLCPPGYVSLTHRLVEALVRGSIPVVNQNELKLYDMQLQDGINCIAVTNNEWVHAVERIYQISPEKLFAMRGNIMLMKDKFLLPEVAAKRLRNKMGLQ